MALSDEVLSAIKYAKRVAIVRNIKFEKKFGSTNTVTLNGIDVIETDSPSEATALADAFNTALKPALDAHESELETIIDGIIT